MSKGKNHLIYKMGGETNCNVDLPCLNKTNIDMIMSYDKLRYKAKAEDDLFVTMI